MTWRTGMTAMLAAVLMLGLPGCTGTTTPDPTTASIPASPQQTPVVNALDDAITQTAYRGSAAMEVDIATTVAGVDDRLQGTVNAAFRARVARIDWTSQSGPTKELVTHKGVFVQLDPPDGGWLLAPDGTPTIDAAFPLRGMDQLRSVRVDGTEELDGESTTRYVGVLPAAGHLDGMGLNPAAQESVAADPEATMEVTVWVGPDGLIRRVARLLRTAADVRASSVTDLTTIGVPGTIDTPSSYATAM